MALAFDNRGSAYFKKGDYDRATADYDQAIRLEPKFWHYLIRGLSNLYGGSLPKALADLNQASGLNSKEPYAALWLDIVNKRSNLESRLPQAIPQLDMTKWPAPVIHMFLGQATLEAVLAAAADPDASIKKGQVCEGMFYGGELALQKAAKHDAARLFRLAVEECPKGFIKSRSATAELKALGVTP